MVLVGISWCFSCVLHDSLYPNLHSFEMQCKGNKKNCDMQVFPPKILRFFALYLLILPYN